MKVNEVVHSCVAKPVFWSLPSVGIVFSTEIVAHLWPSEDDANSRNATFYNDILIVFKFHLETVLANPHFCWIPLCFIVFLAYCYVRLVVGFKSCTSKMYGFPFVLHNLLKTEIVFGNGPNSNKICNTHTCAGEKHNLTRCTHPAPTDVKREPNPLESQSSQRRIYR